MRGMNKLPLAKRVQILAMLCEGSSMRSTARVADVAVGTVVKLLVDAGEACAAFHDEHVRCVKAKRVQVDEIWSFTYAKAKNVPTAKAAPEGAGDTWTWTAIDADTKLIVSWLVGGRDSEYAAAFIDDLRARLANRVQLTSDGHGPYLQAVEDAFGDEIDYAMLVKLYGAAPAEGAPGSAQRRYSPGQCIGTAYGDHHRQPAPGARQHELRRAPEPDHADADAAVHTAHERLLEEVREPHAHGCAVHRLVQLRAHPQDAARHSGYGRRADGPAVEHGGSGRHDRRRDAEARQAWPLQNAPPRNFKLIHYPRRY
jgi:hypothetical protein